MALVGGADCCQSDVWNRESSSEDEVLIVFGAELDVESCGEGDHWEQVSNASTVELSKSEPAGLRGGGQANHRRRRIPR